MASGTAGMGRPAGTGPSGAGGIFHLFSLPAVVLLMVVGRVLANLPTFDEDSRMRILLLPLATRAGSTIYRVRASDPEFEHPLEFSFMSNIF